MGYGIIPDLTTGEYMCLTPCNHLDCKANKIDFIDNNKCVICGKELKPGDKFYYCEQGKNDKVHMACEIDRIQNNRS